MRFPLYFLLAATLFALPVRGLGKERTERFDSDPGWDAYNNRSTAFSEQKITQRFGHSPTHHAGGKYAGEMGGLINPAAEPAFYAKVIPTATFDSKLTASGTVACPGEMPFHALIGFFHADTLNEWRTPNTISIRIQGRGGVFFAYVEYATRRWRAGGDSPGGFSTSPDPDSDRLTLQGFKTNGAVHRWSITYDPNGNNGNGSIEVRIDDEKSICHISPEHRMDGATFNRFGLLPVMKQWDNGGEIWLDDISVNGELEEFSSDPNWDARHNNRTYVSGNVRPRFDFGYGPTNFAGGARAGEMGGLVFRGDIREPHRMAYYGDRVKRLSLSKPMRASGKISLRRGVSDSGTLIGFFNSKESIATNPSQSSALPGSFMGAAIEGPSREGFLIYPAFRDARESNGRTTSGPHILPDGSTHDWALEYSPLAPDQAGQITVTLDGETTTLTLSADEFDPSTTFDRFGIVTAWVDGNGQTIYFDDLTYTCEQNE
jgi:hypothetical protein